MIHFNNYYFPVTYLILGLIFIVFMLLIFIGLPKILNHKSKKSISLDILVNRYAIRQNTMEGNEEKKSDDIES